MNLNQISIPSIDLNQSIPFYQKLGLTLIVKSLPDYARFECPNGEATFSIHRVDKLPTGDGVYIYFECLQLDKKVQVLISENFHFDLLPTDQPWLWREARLRDLDNNLVILFHAGENRKYPPWRV